MKISVSFSSEVVVYLDDYARAHGIASRSAVLQRAVELLRADNLAEAYTEAFTEWAESDDPALWDSSSGDGLVDADPALAPADAAR